MAPEYKMFVHDDETALFEEYVNLHLTKTRIIDKKTTGADLETAAKLHGSWQEELAYLKDIIDAPIRDENGQINSEALKSFSKLYAKVGDYFSFDCSLRSQFLICKPEQFMEETITYFQDSLLRYGQFPERPAHRQKHKNGIVYFNYTSKLNELQGFLTPRNMRLLIFKFGLFGQAQKTNDQLSKLEGYTSMSQSINSAVGSLGRMFRKKLE